MSSYKKSLTPRFEMPRACPVVFHDEQLQKKSDPRFEMPRACPAVFHDEQLQKKSDPRFAMPRACPAVFHDEQLLESFQSAASVNYHGPSPWHPTRLRTVCFSFQHDAPPGKPVVSIEPSTKNQEPRTKNSKQMSFQLIPRLIALRGSVRLVTLLNFD